jgi:NADPH-dependent 2,4-dienoyl-CoA reductase/sulfur reductase-like enzyme
MHRVLVVGASAAGIAAVRELRRSGFEGQITLVGSEPELPYRRPELSKKVLLADSTDGANLALPFGAELSVDVLLGAEARTLDLAQRRVSVVQGPRRHDLGYDGLIICTGVRARPSPWRADLGGVYVLRSLQDSIRIRDALRSSPRTVIIGAGFIGLEVAAAARSLGLQVTIVETLSSPLAQVLGPQVGDRVADLHRVHDVRIICGMTVATIDGARTVESVTLSDGRRLDADMVIVAIGTQPATEWLVSSGLPLGDGVMCGPACNVPDAENVVAAGDVANWYNPLFETRMRVEHWTNATEQATFAAQTLLAGPGDRAFASVPFFWSEQYGHRLQFVGTSRDFESVLAPQPAEPGTAVFLYTRADRIIGAFGIDASAELARYRRLVVSRASVKELSAQVRELAEPEHLASPR